MLTCNLYAEQTFERGFGTPYEDIGTAVCHTSNTGYVVGGKTKGFSAGANYDFYFVKFNLAGNVLWSNHSGGNYDEIVTGVIEYTGGELYAVGNSTNTANTYGRVLLTKLNATGQILWTKFVGDTNLISSANELIVLPNGNIAICGRTGYNLSSALIQIVDTTGDILSTRNFQINSKEEFKDLITTNDGQIAACTSTIDGAGKYIMVFKMNLFGDTFWTYKSTPYQTSILYCNSIVQGPSNNYYVGGYLESGWYHSFYHQIDENKNFISHVLSISLSDASFDLAIDTVSERIYSASGYYNYIQEFACQAYDTTITNPSSLFRYFDYDSYSFQYANNITTPAYAIDIKPDLLNLSTITLVGGTLISSYGDMDLAIVHTDNSLITKCQSNRPRISALSPTTICPGDSVLIILDSVPYLNHRWADFSWNRLMDLGENSDSIWVKSPGIYFYIGFDADSIIWISNEVRITVIDTPSTLITASGPINYCKSSGATLSLSVPSVINLTYQWYLNNSAIPYDTTSSISADSSGQYFCRVSNGCSFFDSNTKSVNSEYPPYANPDLDNTSNNFSEFTPWCSYTPKTIALDSLPGTTYQWLLNGAPLAGQTSPICYIISAGDYSCILTNSCGIDTGGTAYVFDVPPPPPYYSGSNMICSSLDSILLSCYYSFNASQWFLNNIPISGATGQSIYAKQSGIYTYQFSAVNCSNFNILSSATTIIQGTKPNVNLGNDTLICYYDSISLDAGDSTAISYLWSTGETTQSIIASSSFPDTIPFIVQVQGSNLCDNYDTLNIIFDICTKIEPRLVEDIKLYPTTTQDQLTLEIPENISCIVKIFDPLGKMVYEKPTNENNIQLNVSELSSGFYLLYIERNNKRSEIFKFIKTN